MPLVSKGNERHGSVIEGTPAVNSSGNTAEIKKKKKKEMKKSVGPTGAGDRRTSGGWAP